MGGGPFAVSAAAVERQFQNFAPRSYGLFEGPEIPKPAPTSTATPVATTAGGGTTDTMKLYEEALKRLSGGGVALEASLADIEAKKREAIAAGEQNLISGGLAGTTVMGSVPLAAEKGASLARLQARGETESKYLQTLVSFANFAQQAKESQAERDAAMQRLQLQLGTQEKLAAQELARPTGGGIYVPESERYTAAYSYGASRPTETNYANQFPSVYNVQVPTVNIPDWTA